MTSVSKLVIVALALLGLALFILKDALFLGGAFYQRDILSVYVPAAEAFVRTVTEGALPLRDPTSGFGQPLLGNPDAQILYPTTWLHLIMLPERVYPLFVLIHYVLGAVGAGALGWRFSRSATGAFFAGAFWLVSGPLQSFLNLWHHLAGAAWMPWVLTAFDRLLERTDRRRSIILAGAFGLQILAGSADMCAMTMSLAFLRLLCEMRAAPSPRLLTQLKAALVSLAIAASLGAGVWLTVLEVTRSSLRGAMPEAIRTYWSVHPALAAEFVLPMNLGDLDLNQDTKDVLFEGREPFVRSLFLGSLVLPLFCGALFSSSIPWKYRVFAGIGALTCAMVSFGRYTPAYSLLTNLAPMLKILRYPSKLMIPLSLLTSVLAGVGVSRLLEEPVRRAARVTGGFLVALHLGLWLRAGEIVPLLIRSADPAVHRLTSTYLEANLLASMASLVLLLVSLAKRRPRAIALSGCAGVIASLMIQSHLNPVVPRSVLRYKPESVDAVKTVEPSRLYVDDYVHFPDRSRQFLGRDSPFMGVTLDGLSQAMTHIVSVRSTLTPPAAGAWGIEYAWDMDLRGLYDKSLRDMSQMVRDLDGTSGFLRVLQIANVSHTVSLHTSPSIPLLLERTVETPLPEPLYVFKVPDTLPRAYAVSGVRVLDTPEAARVVLDPGFTPTREVTFDEGSPRAVSKSFTSQVRIVDRRSDRTALEVTLNEPGSVVLVEGFLPGWSASIDGVRTPVRRANAFFLGVSAPAGTHQVVFLYRPWTAVLGISLTLLTAFVLLASLATLRSRRSP